MSGDPGDADVHNIKHKPGTIIKLTVETLHNSKAVD